MRGDWVHPVSIRILEELEKGKKNIRELSSSVGLSYEPVYSRVKLLQEENLIKTKRVGREVVLSLKDSPIVRVVLQLSEALKFREALRKAEPRVREAAMSVVEVMEKEFPHQSVDVYFYGSFAKGTSRRGSDVDVMMVAPREHVEEIDAKVGDVTPAHVFVIDGESFDEKLREKNPHIKSVLSGIHLRLPLYQSNPRQFHSDLRTN